MSLSAGTRLGPYEVVAPLGSGGMGEVYRARDPRLGREVAIKVLPESFAADPDRVARFEREARTLASLNHPHVATIHGIEDTDGRRALVMELVEGPTLAGLLGQSGRTRSSARPGLPPDEALPIARQIAEALEAAHDAGVVHRDLKPANVKVRADGTVKVLDFGLAKVIHAGPSPAASAAPTISAPTALTHQGVLLGTAAYMSPEQARGKPVDRSTDLWAFGCVLFEMLTGRRAFDGDSLTDVLAAIVGAEPDWSALPADTPWAIRMLLRQCLRKRPEQRLRDARTARVMLEEAGVDPVSGAPAASPDRAASGPSRRRVLQLAGAALPAAGLGWVAALSLRDAAPPAGPVEVRRFSMDLGLVRPVISPNGRHIAYRLEGRLWVRDLSSETPREIPGGLAFGGFNSDEAYYLTWSPDSRDIAFLAGDELRRVSVHEGGSAAVICTLPAGPAPRRWLGGMAWSAGGGTIVFSRYGAGIFEVPAGGGPPVRLWEENHADDLILFETPEGRAVLFASTGEGGGGPGHGLVVRPPDGTRRLITQLDSNWPELLYSPTGHVLFRHNPQESPSLWALPFSSRTLTAQGEPFLLLRPGFQPSLSAEGTLAYLDTGRAGVQHLAWRDYRGDVLGEAADGHEIIEQVSVAPDGRRAVVVARDAGQTVLWLYDLQRFGRRRVELGEAAAGDVLLATWSGDGTDIYATVASSSSSVTIVRVPAAGGGEPERLLAPDRLPPSVGASVAMNSSRDGRRLVALHGPVLTEMTIWLWTREDAGGGFGSPVQISGETGAFAQLAPDGRHMAFTSRSSGRLEIWLQSVPDGVRHQVSFDGGASPLWAADGTEIFYNARGTLMRVPVGAGGRTSPGLPEPRFEHPRLTGLGAPFARFAVSADGERFLTVESDREPLRPMVRLVQNWPTELLS